MITEQLKNLVKNSPLAQLFFGEMANRQNNQKETKVDRVVVLLSKKSVSFERKDVVALFRALEKCGLGRFKKGAHGSVSRFVWNVKATELAQQLFRSGSFG